jgi:tRNA(Ile)-lysidine synthase
VSASTEELLEACAFPPAGTVVTLAVSGGPDSVGLLLLAQAAELSITVQHVDHHARPTSGDDAAYVRALCATRGVPMVLFDVDVVAGANFEARARAERKRVLGRDALTGHTMDDLVETVLVNMLRGAGVDGLSPMVNDPTKPLRSIRRSVLHAFVDASGVSPRHDESNDDAAFVRNRVRHELLPLMCDIASRDVTPLIARQADVLFEDRSWLDVLSAAEERALPELDCRELREWPSARLRRWLRSQLASPDEFGDVHPPSAAEVDRAIAVVCGEVTAMELSGGRRLSRSGQRLSLQDNSTTVSEHG